MRHLALLLLLVLGSFSQVAAKPPDGVLKGVVLDGKDRPVAAARVFLESADGTLPHLLRTDAQGRFRLAGLRKGLYDVRAEAAGTDSAWLHNIVVNEGAESEVTLKLALRAGAQPSR